MNWGKFCLVNSLTLIRFIGIILIIPIFNKYGNIYAFILCAICFLTDWFDGILARRLNYATYFGSLFDSITDKLFLIVNMIIYLKITDMAIISIILELCIATIQAIKYIMNISVKSNIYGKVKMWIAGITITFSYLLNDVKYLFIIFIISEVITLISYITEFRNKPSNKKRKRKVDIINLLFNPIYYKK